MTGAEMGKKAVKILRSNIRKSAAPRAGHSPEGLSRHIGGKAKVVVTSAKKSKAVKSS